MIGRMGAQQPRARVYIERGIAEYCIASGLNLHSYCKSIEPQMPQEASIIVYNPKNPEHVTDLLDRGCVLISTSLSSMQVKAPPIASMMNDTPIRVNAPPPRPIDIRAALPDHNRNNVLNILKSSGIEYSNDPLRDNDSQDWSNTRFAAPQQQRPYVAAPQPKLNNKQQNAFNALIGALSDG